VSTQGGSDRILVVEDEPSGREMLQRLLARRGYAVEAVADGPACMEWLVTHTCDRMRLDSSMPGMTGLEVLAWLRHRHPPERLPVILVSAHIDSTDVVAGLEAGANDYVVKPVNPPVLLARVENCLRIVRNVERLIDAERHRVRLEAIGRAADELEAPLRALAGDLGRRAGGPGPVTFEASDLAELQQRLAAACELVRRFRLAASARTQPWTEGISSLVDALLEDEGAGEPPSDARD